MRYPAFRSRLLSVSCELLITASLLFKFFLTSYQSRNIIAFIIHYVRHISYLLSSIGISFQSETWTGFFWVMSRAEILVSLCILAGSGATSWWGAAQSGWLTWEPDNVTGWIWWTVHESRSLSGTRYVTAFHRVRNLTVTSLHITLSARRGEAVQEWWSFCILYKSFVNSLVNC